MSVKSNNNGRAFEFALILAIFKTIKKHRQNVILDKQLGFEAAKRAWEASDLNLQNQLKMASLSICESLFNLEPLMLDGSDILELSIQEDKKGESGDVRDILIKREKISWIIGLSAKHNHFALKHSRLSRNLDFGKKWLNIPCSENYFKEISPIFDILDSTKGQSWNILDKENTIYKPLLEAFKKELLRILETKNICQKLLSYLVGNYDFYKIIALDSTQETLIQGFNIYNTLNKSVKIPQFKVKKLEMPTNVRWFDFKENSKNTLEINFNNSWAISLRIHNASSKIESSLKFDIKLIGIPSDLFVIKVKW
ncbi:MAG: HaeIII family restriction endonuclease [Helicobacteraceae bacterium]|nr:HaeIII family restriction endonuclease [Helicobacteraceae bacterium]